MSKSARPTTGSTLGQANSARLERWFRQAYYRLTSPQFLISLVLLAALVFLLLQPLWELTSRTFFWEERDMRLSREAVPGQATLFHWKHILFSPSANAILWGPLINTLVTGGSAAVLALSLGGILAWLVVRTDIPGKRFLRPILTLPYVVPSFALALAWVTLFRSSTIGGVAGFFESQTGIAPPDWLSYGPVPIILAMTIHYYPFAFLLVSGALATVDQQLVESAELLGATRWTILRKIVFPLVTPALLAAFVLIFGKTIGTFALPFILGAPVQYHTLATNLFSTLKLGMEARGYILALVLIVLTGTIVFLNYRILGGASRRFETIGGKGFKSNPTLLGQWRWPAFSFVIVVALVTAILPLGLMIYRTLMLVDGSYGLENFTLHYWIGQSNPEIAHGQSGVLHNPLILSGAWNSIRLAVFSSVICGIIGLVIGYIVVRNRGSLISRLLDQISFIPFLFPAIALGAMYLTMFAVPRGPIPALYGTFALLVLITAVDKLPYSTRTGASAVTQIGRELEDAAEIQGISWFKRFYKVVLPLATAGLVAGMMVSFVSIMRELSLIIFLITPSTGLLMTLGFRYAEEGQPQLANALILLVTLITIVGELIIWRIGKGRLARLQEK